MEHQACRKENNQKQNFNQLPVVKNRLELFVIKLVHGSLQA